MSRKKKTEAWGENGFEDWGGYMAAKKAKLEEQFRSEASKEHKETTSLFNGIAIFVNGYTDPTADELRRLMMAHGGIYHHYMRPRITTHVIASNLPYSKIVMYRKSQNPVPICKPEWITDSIKAGRVLNYQNYLLYTNCTETQPQLMYKVQSKDLLRKETRKEAGLSDHLVTDTRDNGKNLANDLSSRGNETKDKENGKKSANELSSRGHETKENGKKESLKDKQEESTEEERASTSDCPVPSRSDQINDLEPVKIPRNQARSTKDSEFLSEFYSHSRLHHIATMGATFKDYVNELRDRRTCGKFPGLERLRELKAIRRLSPEFDCDSSLVDEEERADGNLGRVIMHIDMDCFFVSVGIRDRPELKGVPVAVTHAKANSRPATATWEEARTEEELGSLSEVASCSYEARKAGIKNGMFLGEALKLCPGLKTIKYDFDGYKEVSYILYDTVASYTLDIEAVSCDEMYADCTRILEESSMTPMEFAGIIRDEIKEKTGCPVSTGFGANKLLARLATKRAKPDGQYYIRKDQVESYLADFDVRELPGVGYTTSHKLNNMNIRTCRQLQSRSLALLQKDFGKKMGEVLYNMCRGVDHSRLNLEHVRKSVSAEVNYGIRFETNDDAVDFLRKLSAEVCNRLKKANAKGRSITLKLMVRAKEAPKDPAKFMGHGLCDYMTRSKNLISAIDDVEIITKEVIALWNQSQQIPEDMRGIGIQITRLQILKSKCRDATLAGFVSKSKQNQGVEVPANRALENEPSKSSLPEKPRPKDLRTFFPSKQSEVSEPSTSSAVPEVAPIREENLQLPADISESVFTELPKEIQDEILSFARVNIRETETPKGPSVSQETEMEKGSTEDRRPEMVQTRQENFFKQTKPGSFSRPGKAEMPPLQEIDMSVLIELPEDIRNEILNEYRSNKREDRQETRDKNSDQIQGHGQTNEREEGRSETDKRLTRLTCETNNRDEANISFSQVDPEFLAALSEDLRRDVQAYCDNKKTVIDSCIKTKDRSAPGLRKDTREEVVSNKSKGSKSRKPEQSKKAKSGKGSKGPKSAKTKGIKAAFEKTTGPRLESDKARRDNGNESMFNKGETRMRPIGEEEAEIILSHNRTITNEDKPMDEHQLMLISLVNHLCNLPLEQVKLQIQTWINNSEAVNEVDFLSLATFLSMLPERRRIEDLHVLLKTMHRCATGTGSCVWHRTYRKAVGHVQHYMRIEYDSDLMVPRLKCDRQQCNADLCA